MNNNALAGPTTAVVIPCYRCSQTLKAVVRKIPSSIHRIYIVDDACPEQSYKSLKNVEDDRIHILHNQVNKGVGGAVIKGFEQAIRDGISIVIKIDGDDQMDSTYIDHYLESLSTSDIDYVKGNRFFWLQGLNKMPFVRVFGNSCLSLLSKISTGYWNMTDPTNGFIGMKTSTLLSIDYKNLDSRYFFETDLLFQLGLARANIYEIYMPAIYGSEKSNLNELTSIFTFFSKNLSRAIKRIFYNYFLREFNYGTISLMASVVFNLFGLYWGVTRWVEAAGKGEVVSSGTTMMAALPIIVGIQLFLFFLQYDIGYLSRHQKGVAQSQRLAKVPDVAARGLPSVAVENPTIEKTVL